jgi:hypothetical protein
MKSLVVYLVEKYRKLFESITYVGTFQNLILRYEQGVDNNQSTDSQGLTVPQL